MTRGRSTPPGTRETILEALLDTDPDGRLPQITEDQAADLAAGRTWGVYHGDLLLGTFPARYLAESDARERADPIRDRSPYLIRQMCQRCTQTPMWQQCCSSHRHDLCHGCYRHTHFVMVCVDGCRACAAEGLPVLLLDPDTGAPS